MLAYHTALECKQRSDVCRTCYFHLALATNEVTMASTRTDRATFSVLLWRISKAEKGGPVLSLASTRSQRWRDVGDQRLIADHPSFNR